MAAERLLVQIASYNTNLQAERGLPQDLVDWLAPTLQVSNFLAHEPRAPDFVAVGFQELLPLHLGLSGLSGKVIEDRNALILSQIESHAPNKERYTLIATVVNVGVALLVYGRDDGVARRVEDVQTAWTGCGPMYMGNKGAVGVRFRVRDVGEGASGAEAEAGAEAGAGEVFTFVCAHLTAHSHKLARRIEDYRHIVSTLLFSGPSGVAETMYATSHLFFFGDLNFRVSLPPEHPLAHPAQTADLARVLEQESVREELAAHDQLRVERDERGSAFVGFREGEFWRFKCTYKYKLGEVDKYDLKRHPAWTDRIMFTTYTDSPDTPLKSNITNALYTSIPSYTTSDHKPVVAVLLLPPSASPLGPCTLALPAGFTPRVDRCASLKRYTGRTLDRAIGYCWWLLVLLGVGSPFVGIGNFVLGLGIMRWWTSRAAAATPDSLG